MAGDGEPTLRRPSQEAAPGATSPSDQVQSPQVYETFNTPPSSANALPDGYGQNTAGARQEALSLKDAVKTVRIQDFLQVHMYPCARESLLNAFGGGFAIGGIRALLGAPVFKSCSWAVGSFCFVGIGAYEFCLQRRRLEKANMKRAVEIMDRKKSEKESKAQERRDARRKAKEEADRMEEEAARPKSSWKFW